MVNIVGNPTETSCHHIVRLGIKATSEVNLLRANPALNAKAIAIFMPNQIAIPPNRGIRLVCILRSHGKSNILFCMAKFRIEEIKNCEKI